MARMYSDQSYAGKKMLNMGNKGSIDGTYQSAVDVSRVRFMFPATVTDWNVSWLTGGTNWGADTILYIGKSSAGTGAVTAFGTLTMGTDGTQADASVQDGSCTSTTFSTGDDLVFQIIGTVGLASVAQPCVQYVEAFVESDS